MTMQPFFGNVAGLSVCWMNKCLLFQFSGELIVYAFDHIEQRSILTNKMSRLGLRTKSKCMSFVYLRVVTHDNTLAISSIQWTPLIKNTFGPGHFVFNTRCFYKTADIYMDFRQ